MRLHLPAQLRRLHRRHVAIGLLGTIVLGLLAIFLALEALSYGAAGIFNRVAEQQDMLHGHVRVEKLFAHINGHVRFEGLTWEDEAGNPVLIVPEGEFYVKPWDVLTGHLSARSLTSITLRDAAISLRIRKDPQTKKPAIDFVTPSGAAAHARGTQGARRTRPCCPRGAARTAMGVDEL